MESQTYILHPLLMQKVLKILIEGRCSKNRHPRNNFDTLIEKEKTRNGRTEEKKNKRKNKQLNDDVTS